VEEQRRAPGRLEEEILAILSARGTALTPAQVRRELSDELAYTTVMTVLTRLHAKGFLAREPVGRGFSYRWLMDGTAAAAHQMGRLLDRTDDRAGVLAQFVNALSPADEAVLTDLLRRANKDQP
jgi:predicted transcriptional regulator